MTVTYNGRDVVWPDGRPVRAGDLREGQAFEIDPDTGVIKLLTDEEFERRHPRRRCFFD